MHSLAILIPLLVAFRIAGALFISSTTSQTRDLVVHRPLDVRDVKAGGSCGSSAGNAVCAAGLCCSATGICGTGISYCSAPDCQLSFGPGCDGNQVPSGQDTSKVPRPTFGSVSYGVSISHCTTNGKVALTFDDGPYIYTSELLDTLKKNGVKATFFIVGNNGGKGQIQLESTGYPAILQRMYADGHQIASHSWSHQNMALLTAQQRHDQIIRNEIALVDILGFIPTYFRPPYSQCPDECLKDLGNLGYHVVNYDIDTRDWQGDYTYAQNTYSSILSQHSPGTSSWISLAHDIQPNTVHSFAQYMIDQARKLGYELVPLGQCLGDPEANWYRDPVSGQPWTYKAQSSAASTTVSPTTTSLSSIAKTTTEVALSVTNVMKQSAVLSSWSASSSSVALGSASVAISSPASAEQMSLQSGFATSMSASTDVTISAIPMTAPTSVSGGNFGAGTAIQTSLSPADTSISIGAKPSSSNAVHSVSSFFGLITSICGLLLLF